jgi:hypothetical protein
MKPKSLAQITREAIEQKPYMMYALEQGFANYSALGKQLQPQITEGLGRDVSIDAVAVSIRRYAETLKEQTAGDEKQLLELLSKTQINLKNGIADVTFKKGELKTNGAVPRHTISGSNADTLILNQEYLEKLDTSEAIEVRKNLVEISIITPPDVETTRGFVQYTTGLLANNGINIVEVLSCYTDTIFIIDESDATKAYEILSSKTKS